MIKNVAIVEGKISRAKFYGQSNTQIVSNAVPSGIC